MSYPARDGPDEANAKAAAVAAAGLKVLDPQPGQLDLGPDGSELPGEAGAVATVAVGTALSAGPVATTEEDESVGLYGMPLALLNKHDQLRQTVLLERLLDKERAAVAAGHGEGDAERDADDSTPEALAWLRSERVVYTMRAGEIVLGRDTESFTVDVNLVHAGVASQTGRVSRRHALISLKSDGEFYIKNIGKRPIDVNGRPVWRGTKCRLPHDSLIEIANIFLLFSINTPFVAKIQRQLRQKTLL
eukprot:g6295.t1